MSHFPPFSPQPTDPPAPSLPPQPELPLQPELPVAPLPLQPELPVTPPPSAYPQQPVYPPPYPPPYQQPMYYPQPYAPAPPVYQQPYTPPMYQPPLYAPAYYPPPIAPTNTAGRGMGIAALVLGILSIVCVSATFFGALLGLLATILGALGRSRLRRDGRPTGVATGGMVTGIIGLLLGVLVTASYLLRIWYGGGSFYTEESSGLQQALLCLLFRR